MDELDVSKVEKTVIENLDFATEIAWASFCSRLILDGVIQTRPAGFEYADSNAKELFRQACKALAVSMGVQLEEKN